MDKVPCSKTQHLVLGGAELLTPNLDLEALPFHSALQSAVSSKNDKQYGRTESREICQNVFLCYNNDVWRFIYTLIYIQVNCEPCYLSAGL